MEKVSSLPDAVVSALHPVPFSTKTETMTPQSQSFMSFTWEDKDGSKARKEWISAVKEEVTVGGSVAMMAGVKTEQKSHALAGEVKELTMKREEEGVTIASLEDGSIGLRLGKRTYYGEVGGAEEVRGRVSNSRTFAGSCKDGTIKNSVNVSCAATADTTAPTAISATTAGTVNTAAITISTTNNIMSSSVGNNNTRSSSSNTALVATIASTAACTTSPATISVGNNGNHLPSTNNNNTKISSGGITNKKQKGSSASITVPSCQAEGCTADLSEAKEYHRRHKVCEWHSKASRAKVNNLEQRFCQQCSRFHVLSAFDEGKRSCRRRLAGHNERRRKPPPEPMPFLSPAGFTYFADGRVNAALHEHPYFLQHRPASLVSVDNSVLASQLGLAGFPQREAMSNYHALEFHRFMRGLSPMVGSGVGVLDGTGALMTPNGSALALSSVLSSQTTPSSSSSVSLLPHVSSEMAISGRALSLLSSSLGSPETMSISLGMTSPSIDQYLPDNHPLSSSSRHQAPVDSTSCFNSAMGMPSSALHGLQRNHINSLNSITSSSSGCSVEMDQGRPPSISSFEGRSLILTKADGAFQNLQDGVNCNQGRPVLDLMHISPAESHHQQQQQQHSQAELSYAYLQGFSIFNKENAI
ncbi:hypothetical protein KP509_25G025600 [Ceratopteris richardii]|nr:hypothetical protein KP509_25G025600 [Ceratopteris richardii]